MLERKEWGEELMAQRLDPVEAARQYIDKEHPGCRGALLAGSVTRGQATSTSDLDIVVFDEAVNRSYRESLTAFGWPIEVFVHNLESYQSFFDSDRKAAKPSMPRMVSEGVVLKDSGILMGIKKEADALLSAGPDAWPDELIRQKRYFITDVLDDFLGSEERGERLFCANALADLVSEFILRTERKWIGTSKWVVRSLAEYDPALAAKFVEAFDDFYRTGGTAKVEAFTDAVLEPFGGRLFDGFSLGKEQLGGNRRP